MDVKEIFRIGEQMGVLEKRGPWIIIRTDEGTTAAQEEKVSGWKGLEGYLATHPIFRDSLMVGGLEANGELEEEEEDWYHRWLIVLREFVETEKAKKHGYKLNETAGECVIYRGSKNRILARFKDETGIPPRFKIYEGALEIALVSFLPATEYITRYWEGK